MLSTLRGSLRSSPRHGPPDFGLTDGGVYVPSTRAWHVHGTGRSGLGPADIHLFVDYSGQPKLQGKSARKIACQSFGTQTHSPVYGDLHHCGGNDTVFAIQKFMALGLMDGTQTWMYMTEHSLPALPTSFRHIMPSSGPSEPPAPFPRLACD